MRNVLAFLFFAGSATVFGQSITDVHVAPRPYLYKAYYGDTIRIPARKITYLKTYDRNRGKLSDTISINEYDSQGRKTVYLSFDSRGKKKRYDYVYSKDRVVWTEQGQPYKSECRSTYRDDGKLAEIYSYDLKGKDTLHNNKAVYDYNDAGRLVKKRNFYGKKLSNFNQYSYNEGKLTCFRSHMNADDLRYYAETEYHYSSEGLLTAIRQSHFRDQIKDSLGYDYFTYAGDKVTGHRYWFVGTPESRCTYTYNANGALESVFVTRETDTLRVDYQYDDLKRLVTKKHYTNTWKSFPQALFVKSLGQYTPMPLRMDEVYGYDGKGNFISRKRYENGVLSDEYVFEITY